MGKTIIYTMKENHTHKTIYIYECIKKKMSENTVTSNNTHTNNTY